MNVVGAVPILFLAYPVRSQNTVMHYFANLSMLYTAWSTCLFGSYSLEDYTNALSSPVVCASWLAPPALGEVGMLGDCPILSEHVSRCGDPFVGTPKETAVRGLRVHVDYCSDGGPESVVLRQLGRKLEIVHIDN